MAPEIIDGKKYRPEDADLFALGVILFTMLSGLSPFRDMATESDPIYATLKKNRPDIFWKIHS